MIPKNLFVGWNEPLADVVASWLWKDRDQLRHRLVVVPTREAGRRLREVLLEKASAGGTGALLGPRVCTPEDFFRVDAAMPDCVRWAAWVKVLGEATDSDCRALFPQGVTARDSSWRLSVARQMEQARELLASVNAGFDQVAAEAGEDAERWQDLARLEQLVVAHWQRWDVRDPVAAKRDRAGEPSLPAGVEEIIVAGVADPTWLAVEAWKRLGQRGVPITVLVGAPGSLSGAFDAWGRPDPRFWADRRQHVTPEPDRVIIAADPPGVAEAVVQACGARSNQELAVGVCDSEFVPILTRRFGEAGWIVYDPEALPVAAEGWPQLLELLARAVEAPDDFAALVAIARHPVIWDAWLAESGARAAFAALDEWEKRHGVCHAAFSGQLAAATDPALQAAGNLLQRVRTLISGAGHEEAFIEVLRELLLRASREVWDLASSELEGWEVLRGLPFGLPMRLRWLAASVSSLTRNTDPSGASLALQGWLELPFDPAPHLVVSALHEGKVPEAPASSPLITEVIREKFGLRDRTSRLARDLYLWTAMVESRRAGGSVTVVNSQVDPRGEPCKPSRLLLHARPEDLPRRVQTVIRELPDVAMQSTPAWNRGGWLLRPGADTPRNRDWRHISPSTLRSYLACPTRFYFSEVLGCEEFELFQQELDAGGFGDLLHQVLQRWGGDQHHARETNPDKLVACWLALLKELTRERFGTSLPPLLQLQVLSAEERLTALAKHQAQQAADGWEIIELEKTFEGALELAGVPLKVRIDRIDRHKDGRYRVIDYKTGRKAEKPEAAHLAVWNEEMPEALGPLVERGKKPRAWVDLQLPLYALVVQKEFQLPEAPTACYALIPEAVTETGFVEFPGIGDVLDSAHQWAQEATRRILDGVFWPPAGKVRYDALQALAPEGLKHVLEPDWAGFLSGPAVGSGAATEGLRV